MKQQVRLSRPFLIQLTLTLVGSIGGWVIYFDQDSLFNINSVCRRPLLQCTFTRNTLIGLVG